MEGGRRALALLLHFSAWTLVNIDRQCWNVEEGQEEKSRGKLKGTAEEETSRVIKVMMKFLFW